MGKVLIVVGLVIAVIGVVIHFAPWLVNWFGKLPGDIRIEKEGMHLFIPITSMLIISIVVSLLLAIFRR